MQAGFRIITAERRDAERGKSAKSSIGGRVGGRRILRGQQWMSVRRNLINSERDFLGSTGFGENEGGVLVDGNAAAQIGQSEGFLPVAAVRRSDQLEKRFVFGNGKQLASAKHPAGGSKISREHSDFTNVRLRHKNSSSRAWKNSLQRDAKAECQEGLHVEMRLGAARVGHRIRGHHRKISRAGVKALRGRFGQDQAGSGC